MTRLKLMHRPHLWLASLVALMANCSSDGAAPTPGSAAGAAGKGNIAGSSASGGAAGAANAAGSGGSVGVAGGASLAGADTAGEAGEPNGPKIGLCAGGVDCDWVGVIGTGQSLSVGVGTDMAETAPEHHNLMLGDSAARPNYDYVNDAKGESQTLSALPLVDPVKHLACSGPLPDCGFNTDPAIVSGGYSNQVGDGYPNNIYGETPHVALAHQLTELAMADGAADYVTVTSVVGSSGKPMDYLRKGSTSGNSYAAGMFESHAFARLAKAAGKSLGYGGITLTHGETDANNGMFTDIYEAALAKLQQDYSSELVALTGQTREVPLIVSQQHTCPGVPNSAYTAPAASGYPTTAQAAWLASIDYPGRVLVSGPKYQFEYAPDNLHLRGAGYRRLGEKYAEVFYRVTELQQPWQPLQPKQVTRSATNTITLTFDVPYPPLVWDETLSTHQTPNHPWAQGRGFEVLSTSGTPVTIASVDLDTAQSQVTLHLTGAPSGRLMVQYAMSQDATSGFQGGTALGRRGQLRDSDPFIGRDQQKITCTVQAGSAELTGCTTPLRPARGVHDIVVEAGASITAIKSTTDATLSGPVPGPSGQRELTFHSNQYNYCVAFSMLADDPSLAPHTDHDLNGDGKPDIVWRNGTDGRTVAYLLNGTALSQAVSLPSVTDQAWQLEGAASDFDHNGDADLVWRNYSTGDAEIWLIADGAYSSKVALPKVTDLDFHLESSADFDQDGSPDLVWRNYSSGDVVLWPMAGTTCAAFSGPLCTGTTLGFQVKEQNFKIRGAADVDHDGNVDIVWHNVASNALVIWYMNGSQLSRVVTLDDTAPAGQLLEAVADFDADGFVDFLFRDPKGTTPLLWLLKRQQLLSKAMLPASDNVAWTIGSR